MKKMFFAFAVGLLAMLTACNKDEVSSLDNEHTSVTFNLKTPTGTRIGGCTRFVIEVYPRFNVSGIPAQRIEYGDVSKPLLLKKGQQYTFLFWADYGNPANGANPSTGDYNVSDLKQVSISAPNQQASYEGFYAHSVITIDTGDKGDVKYNVTLNRAVAKIAYQQVNESFIADNNLLTVTFPHRYKLNVADENLNKVEEPFTHSFNNIQQTSASTIIGESYLFTSGYDPNSELITLKIKFNAETEKTIPNVRTRINSRTIIQGPYSNFYKSSFNVGNTVNSWTDDNFNVNIEFV